MTKILSSAWLLLGLSAMGTCGGNLFLKQASLANKNNYGIASSFISYWFVGAIACYILDLVLFTQALQDLPISYAVPVSSGIRIGMTAFLAYWFFGEQFSFNQIFASSLIISGILIMLRS